MSGQDVQELKRLAGKYYGYIVDMEGSGIEILEMLFVRDKIGRILDHILPEDELSSSLYERLHELDKLLWADREVFLMVMGEKELKYARQQHRSPRSHWWWYLDELQRPPQPMKEQVARLAQDLALATG